MCNVVTYYTVIDVHERVNLEQIYRKCYMYVQYKNCDAELKSIGQDP